MRTYSNSAETLSNNGRCSVSSDDNDELECPICYESFNIGVNVPYVLWCGHTLCQNCVIGLQWAVLKLPTQKVRFPLLISCPWCSSLSLRLMYRGNLRFPQKNYFILWMIERLDVERVKCISTQKSDNRLDLCPRRRSRRCLDVSQLANYVSTRRANLSFQKSLDCVVKFGAKFHLVVIFMIVISMVIPGSVAILVLYLLVTFLLAIPSLFVLYFAYPTLEWLYSEIAN